MLFTFILVVQAIVAASLVGVILMQRSEGGGLGVGGSPSGLMSARGAANFLTRATAILATMFVGLSIVLAVIAATNHRGAVIDADAAQNAPATGAPLAAPAANDDPLAAAAAASNAAAPVVGNSVVPLTQ